MVDRGAFPRRRSAPRRFSGSVLRQYPSSLETSAQAFLPCGLYQPRGRLMPRGGQPAVQMSSRRQSAGAQPYPARNTIACVSAASDGYAGGRPQARAVAACTTAPPPSGGREDVAGDCQDIDFPGSSASPA